MRVAEVGISELRPVVDTMIVIPNQNLFRIATEKTTFAEAFVLADQVLYSGIACIVDLIMKDGLINLDFADVKTVMADMGAAVMGTGEAEGAQRAVLAAEEALANPLLDEVSLERAQGVLISIVGGGDLTLYEVDEAASRVRQEVDPDANIIVGATFDAEFGPRMRVSLVAAGMDRAHYAELQAARGRGGSAEADADREAGGKAVSGSMTGKSGAVASEQATAPPPPPLPRAGEGRSHADRVDDFAKALGAMPPGPTSPATPAPSASSAPKSVAAPSSAVAPAWTSADGVRIAPEAVMAETAKAEVNTPESDTAPTDSHTPSFEPAMPGTARPSEPRMPAVDEFPEPGQRAYRAHTAQQE
ncbi:MAG: cell division protein FtsZ, partial [Pseudomonadota bacterium]